jgi:hypothetical protein
MLAAVALAAASAAAAQTRPPAAPARPAPRGADAGTAAPDGEPAAAPADVTAQVFLDRTAIWVADRVTYTIELTCRRGMDVITDDLSRDKLKLDGLEVLATDTSRQALGDDVVRYRFNYELTTYRVDLPALSVAPLSVRYYVRRAGQRLEDSPPAGDVRVPGAVIAFRSVLPDDQPSYSIRDARETPRRPAVLAALQPLGLGLILASIVPAGVVGLALAGRGRARLARRSARQVRHEERESLDTVRALDASNEESRREIFARVDALVRGHLHEVSGIPAAALATPEVVPALEARGSRIPAELVSSILISCERAKYAPPSFPTTAEACRDAIEQAAQVLAAGR